ncbi:MAG: hypothetical protein JWO14_2482 [Solirubrobacterales bacterium]|nr:hypothetical protein [Solirubrobacterales bacterium]
MSFRRFALLVVCLALVPCSSATAATRPPVATTLGAESFGRREELLHGYVKTYGMATRVRIEFGSTKAYGRVADDLEHPYGWNNGGHAEVEALAEQLRPDRTYHYRLVAWNEAGTSFGKDMTFRTRRANGG